MAEQIEPKRRKPQGSKKTGGKYRILRRVLISVGLTVVLLFLLAWLLIFSVAHGPSPSMRDLLVTSAMQASATKFVPYLVLPASEVEDIMARAASGGESVYDPTQFSDRFIHKIVTDKDGKQYEITVLQGDDGTAVVTDESGSKVVEYNEWDYAIDGIQYLRVDRPNFRAYMLIIKDPSRVYTGTSSDYQSNLPGKRFWEMAEQDGCVALMNAGEFYDAGGQGDGGKPQGLTYSKGKCVYSDSYTWKTFVGFTKDNKMVVGENITKAKAESMGMRDGVCFRPATYSSSSRLIYTDDAGKIHVSTYNSDAPAQRSAIGQRADGAVIFLVTDGRSAASIGASYNDVTQMMLSYGAVTACMLDGGSSAMLYSRNFMQYYELFQWDTAHLDEYQKMGLLNKYVAATKPRRIPTFWCVAPAGGN